MKADKILFGIACVGMTMLCNSALNKASEKQIASSTQSTFLKDTNLKQQLSKDTFEFSASIKQDTAKIIRKIAK